MSARAKRVQTAAADDFDIRGLTSFRVLLLSNTLGRWGAAAFHDAGGLTLPEWRALAVIGSHGPLTANALAQLIATDKGWISRTLAKLTGAGFIRTEHDPTDARKALLTLTAKGRALRKRLVEVSIRRQQRLDAVLSEADRKALDRILEVLQQEAEAMAGERSA